MTILGSQFDMADVSADDDASLYAALSKDRNYILPNRGNGMAVTTNGLSVVVDTGEALIQGRRVKITEPHSIDVPINSSGFIVISIDLSRLNESNGKAGTIDYQFTNNQLDIEYTESLVTSDLNNGGLIYTFVLGKVTSNLVNATFVKDDEAYGTVGDCNSRTTSGLYFAGSDSTTLNSPYESGVEFVLEVIKHKGIVVQKTYPNNSAYQPYFRTSRVDWTDWRAYI